MSELFETLPQIVKLNGGRIVGKTRLQKIFYFLEAKSLGCDLDFDYHNFGPFSLDLAKATDDAEDLGYLNAISQPGYHQVPYIIYESTSESPSTEDDELSQKRRKILGILQPYSALELEVAATAHYLRENGYSDNYVEELKVRKPQKATPERIEKARALISDLGL